MLLGRYLLPLVSFSLTTLARAAPDTPFEPPTPGKPFLPPHDPSYHHYTGGHWLDPHHDTITFFLRRTIPDILITPVLNPITEKATGDVYDNATAYLVLGDTRHLLRLQPVDMGDMGVARVVSLPSSEVCRPYHFEMEVGGTRSYRWPARGQQGTFEGGYCTHPIDGTLAVVSSTTDLLIAFAYFCIPIELFYFIRQHPTVPYPWVFFLFQGFIVMCGLTHLIGAWSPWFPMIRLMIYTKIICAIISCITAALMVLVIPKALELPLNAAAMEVEIRQRLIAERSLRDENEVMFKFRTITHTIRRTLDKSVIYTSAVKNITTTLRAKCCEIHEPIQCSGGQYRKEAFFTMEEEEGEQNGSPLHPWPVSRPLESEDAEEGDRLIHPGHRTARADLRDLGCLPGDDGPIHDPEEEEEEEISRTGDLCGRGGAGHYLRKSLLGNLIPRPGHSREYIPLTSASAPPPSPSPPSVTGGCERINLSHPLVRTALRADIAVLGEGQELEGLYEDGHLGPRESVVIVRFLSTETSHGIIILRRCKDDGAGRASPSREMWTSIAGSFLVDVAEQISIAVNQASLIEQEKLRIHQLAEQNEALLQARKEVELAQKHREFLAVMSHEMRTPLYAIFALTSMVMDVPLMQEEDEEVGEVRDMLEVVRRSGDMLITIINNTLDFSKYEDEHLHLERMPFSLREALETALDIVVLQGDERKRPRINYFLNPSVPSTIIGDMTRIRQILVNLLGNACKFTPPTGDVTLHASTSPTPSRANRLRLSVEVADTGIGIAEKDIPKLFKQYSQADASITRKFGGTGLGLAIVRRLVQLMDGDISVSRNDRAESGTKFSLHIDLHTSLAPETASGKRQSLLMTPAESADAMERVRSEAPYDHVHASLPSPIQPAYSEGTTPESEEETGEMVWSRETVKVLGLIDPHPMNQEGFLHLLEQCGVPRSTVRRFASLEELRASPETWEIQALCINLQGVMEGQEMPVLHELVSTRYPILVLTTPALCKRFRAHTLGEHVTATGLPCKWSSLMKFLRLVHASTDDVQEEKNGTFGGWERFLSDGATREDSKDEAGLGTRVVEESALFTMEGMEEGKEAEALILLPEPVTMEDRRPDSPSPVSDGAAIGIFGDGPIAMEDHRTDSPSPASDGASIGIFGDEPATLPSPHIILSPVIMDGSMEEEEEAQEADDEGDHSMLGVESRLGVMGRSASFSGFPGGNLRVDEVRERGATVVEEGSSLRTRDRASQELSVLLGESPVPLVTRQVSSPSILSEKYKRVRRKSAASAPTSPLIMASPGMEVMGEGGTIRVLMVEDNAINQMVTGRILRKIGQDYEVASDGFEALEKLRESIYHVLLMDISMPGMDGYETTRRIREEWPEDEKRPWIIALTANALWDDRLRCTEAGMNDFVSKPAKMTDLRAALLRYIDRRPGISPVE